MMSITTEQLEAMIAAANARADQARDAALVEAADIILADNYDDPDSAAAAILALRAKPAPTDFQKRVDDWIIDCFGAVIRMDGIERNHRFLEESLELVQSLGCTKTEAYLLVDYVFNRDAGEPAQEVGGAMNTLAALCTAHGLDMAACGETELARVWTKVESIRAKQAAKPKHSPLPQHTSDKPAPALTVDFDALAYRFWSIHPKDIPDPVGMPDGYKGGARAWMYATEIREAIRAIVGGGDE